MWGDYFKKIFLSDPLRQNAIVIVVVFVFLASASYYWFFPILKRVEADAVSSQKIIAESSRDLLEVFLEFTFDDLTVFAAQHFVDPQLHSKFHESFFNEREDFLSFLIISADGQPIPGLVIREGFVSSFINIRSTRGAAFFSEAISNGRYISPVFSSIDGPTLQISSAVRDSSGKILGVAAAEIDFTLIRDVVNRVQVNAGKIYMVDGRGTIVSDPDLRRSNSGENLRFREIIERLVGGEEFVELSRYANENRQDVIAYGLQMPSTGWGIIVEQLESEALKQRNQNLVAATVFTGSSIILVLLILASSLSLIKAISNIERERKEKERVIEFMPDGIIEYTGENKILGINPAAREFLNIKEEVPAEMYITETAAPIKGFEKIWPVFFPRHGTEGGQGGSYIVNFEGSQNQRIKIITVYIKGVGPLWDQRYLKILHDVSKE